MVESVREIVNDYDFIGVTERMDESIVCLQMLLGLDTSDVLALSSKVGGSNQPTDSYRYCKNIPKSYVSEPMKVFFENDPWWLDSVRYDRLRYDTAKRSLDLTIGQLNRSEFERNLDAFRKATTAVKASCGGMKDGTILLPCDGKQAGDKPHPETVTGCVHDDLGCGFECIDRVVRGTFNSDDHRPHRRNF